jgi:hypothetical protein
MQPFRLVLYSKWLYYLLLLSGDFAVILFSTTLLYFLLDSEVLVGVCDLRQDLGYDDTFLVICQSLRTSTPPADAVGSFLQEASTRYYTLEELEDMGFFKIYNISNHTADTILSECSEITSSWAWYIAIAGSLVCLILALWLLGSTSSWRAKADEIAEEEMDKLVNVAHHDVCKVGKRPAILLVLFLLVNSVFLCSVIVYLYPRSALFQNFEVCRMSVQVSYVMFLMLAVAVLLFVILAIGFGFGVHSWFSDRHELKRLLNFLDISEYYKTSVDRKHCRLLPEDPLKESVRDMPHNYYRGTLYLYPSWSGHPDKKMHKIETDFHKNSTPILLDTVI